MAMRKGIAIHLGPVQRHPQTQRLGAQVSQDATQSTGWPRLPRFPRGRVGSSGEGKRGGRERGQAKGGDRGSVSFARGRG